MRDLDATEFPTTVRSTNHLARWWDPEPGGKVHCYLCPRHCHIGPGQAGFCFIRANEGGKLVSLGYAHPAALQIDPIEKKPLNHFLPGTKVFSIGTAGCNMGCFFCQNWSISKSKSDQRHSTYMPPEEVVEMAIDNDCPSIAFTYNEPTIWGEYVVDICKVAHAHGLKTVMVSNGYVTYEAFHDIYDHIDAANIDLKAFTEKFYGGTTLTHLQPVLDMLKWLKNETDVWFEITNLLIPTLNDAPAETRALSEWILENLGPDVPLHFTAFHPDFKLRDKPRTPEETLHAARAIALEVGLHYVYEGNIRSGNENTSCPSCHSLLIRRNWHNVLENHLLLSHPRRSQSYASQISSSIVADTEQRCSLQSQPGKTKDHLAGDTAPQNSMPGEDRLMAETGPRHPTSSPSPIPNDKTPRRLDPIEDQPTGDASHRERISTKPRFTDDGAPQNTMPSEDHLMTEIGPRHPTSSRPPIPNDKTPRHLDPTQDQRARDALQREGMSTKARPTGDGAPQNTMPSEDQLMAEIGPRHPTSSRPLIPTDKTPRHLDPTQDQRSGNAQHLERISTKPRFTGDTVTANPTQSPSQSQSQSQSSCDHLPSELKMWEPGFTKDSAPHHPILNQNQPINAEIKFSDAHCPNCQDHIAGRWLPAHRPL